MSDAKRNYLSALKRYRDARKERDSLEHAFKNGKPVYKEWNSALNAQGDARRDLEIAYGRLALSQSARPAYLSRLLKR